MMKDLKSRTADWSLAGKAAAGAVATVSVLAVGGVAAAATGTLPASAERGLRLGQSGGQPAVQVVDGARSATATATPTASNHGQRISGLATSGVTGQALAAQARTNGQAQRSATATATTTPSATKATKAAKTVPTAKASAAASREAAKTQRTQARETAAATRESAKAERAEARETAAATRESARAERAETRAARPTATPAPQSTERSGGQQGTEQRSSTADEKAQGPKQG